MCGELLKTKISTSNVTSVAIPCQQGVLQHPRHPTSLGSSCQSTLALITNAETSPCYLTQIYFSILTQFQFRRLPVYKVFREVVQYIRACLADEVKGRAGAEWPLMVLGLCDRLFRTARYLINILYMYFYSV